MDDRERTIADFGAQWSRFDEPPEGFYGSAELFRDIVGPLLDPAQIAGATVIDVGAGTGRFVRILAELGARRIVAVEPSRGMAVLRRNTADIADRVDYLETTGDRIPPGLGAGLAVSLGVLHHIPDPDPVVQSIRRALAPGGRVVVWLYGREGNGLYLAFVRPLRRIAGLLPHSMRLGIAWALLPVCDLYMLACRWLPLPLRDFMRGVQARLSRRHRLLNIYDQLNPRYARYYRRTEAIALLERNGFRNVRAHARRGYSWTVVGEA